MSELNAEGIYVDEVDLMPAGTAEERNAKALAIAKHNAGFDGAHHKDYCIDQMVRALTGCPTVVIEVKPGERGSKDGYKYMAQGESPDYLGFVKDFEDGEDGPETYEWETGTPP